MGIIEIRDPIHGFIRLSEDEVKIVNSRPFQRLRHIKQLALTDLVYPGATHTRFEHSLGVMKLVSDAFEATLEHTSKDVFNISDEKKEIYKQIIRLIALTHDLGHAPFSHASEELFPNNLTHEDYTRKVVCETEIADIIKSIGLKYQQNYGSDIIISPKLICDIYSGINPGPNHEYTFLNSFMDGELDCDKMDYLLRDSYFCGVKYGNYDKDRLIESFTIYCEENIPRLAINQGGVQAFEGFVLARYFMFLQVYFHKTRRYFDKVLVDALKEILPGGKYPLDINEYLTWDDDKVFELLKMRENDNDSCAKIINRKISKCVFGTKPHPSQADIREYKYVLGQLKEKIPEDEIFVDESSKLPHKIPKKSEINDEKAIIIFDSDSKRIRSISEESEIINALTEKINIKRIYCNSPYSEEAKDIVRKFNVMQED